MEHGLRWLDPRLMAGFWDIIKYLEGDGIGNLGHHLNELSEPR